MHHVTGLLRDRSGVDGDGASLVGQALGGDTPKLLLNPFQTETERNVQKGIEQILRGFYMAIRNPRSHEKMQDSKQDAEAILCFIDYISKMLTLSREAFTLAAFKENLLDKEFVETPRYAELLIAEVPANRRGEALAEIYFSRRELELRKLKFVLSSLLGSLNEAQISQYLTLVSDDLRSATETADIRTALQMLTPDLWPRITESSLTNRGKTDQRR